MKWLVGVFCLAAVISCSKSDTEIKDPFSYLVLDSLKEISADIPPGTYTDVQFLNENFGYAISNDAIVQSNDGGLHWQAKKSWTGLVLKSLFFTGAQHGFITATDAAAAFLLKTTDGAVSWKQISLNIPADRQLTGLYFIDASNGFLTGNKIFKRTTDGGETWTNVLDGTDDMFGGIAFLNAKEGYVTASNGYYHKTTDGGKTWQRIQTKSTEHLHEISVAQTKVYAKAGLSSLIDLRSNTVLTVPGIVSKFIFITDDKAIGIGQHYETGFWPYGDILVTNNGWRSSETKKYMPDYSIGFRAASKAGDHKTIILGNGHLQVAVVSATY